MLRDLGGGDGGLPDRSLAGPTDTPQDAFTRLPDELLEHILEELDKISKRDVAIVSRLSRKCHRVADAILYRSLSFESPEAHLTFSETLGRRPRRGSMIQDVKLEYPTTELSHLVLDAPNHRSHYAPSRIDGLSRSISTMSNLVTLDVSVPVSMLQGIGTLFNGPFDLACLKSCSLFYQCDDNEYWDLQANIHIFSHPTLETLVIKRARLDEQGFRSLERPEATALKSLHLIECDVNEYSLSDVLEFPEGLKEFVMTQTADPYPDLEESSDDIRDYIIALQSACQTLETIVIDFPTLGCSKALRMRDFAQVTTLRFNWDYQLFGQSSKKPRLTSVGLPPELETLEFYNELGKDEEVTEYLIGAIENKEIMARRLKKLTVPDSYRGVPRGVLEACESVKLDLEIKRPSYKED